jgi:hypothetical protein
MRALILLLALPILVLSAAPALAKSCNAWVIIESYDPGTSTVTVKKEKTSVRKYFPKPEGATGSKIPAKCKSKVYKQGSFPVTATGGRLKITQIRENFSGKMLNDPEDPAWLPAKLQELIDDKTLVSAIMRPPVGKKKPFGVSAVYLPITEAELKEIERLENLASDVD